MLIKLLETIGSFLGYLWGLYVLIALTGNADWKSILYLGVAALVTTKAATSLRQRSVSTSSSSLEQIVNAYGEALSSHSNGQVVDESRLPFPKDTIKSALEQAIRVTRDPQVREYLRMGYLDLADWQKNVGRADIALIPVLNTDLADTNAAISVLEEVHPETALWVQKVEKERMDLTAELKKLGLWS